MNFTLQFPTAPHQQVAEMVDAFFRPIPCVDTILVVNSVARGQATPESDLDMNVLVGPETPDAEVDSLEHGWKAHAAENPVLQAYLRTHAFAHLHLDVVKPVFTPETWDDGGGPDGFELNIGNALAYSAPLGEAGPAFRSLQARWLPFYGEDLRRQRLDMARSACAYDLEHIPFFVRRGLYFQSFDRLYKAYQEFLQALFIARRVYPLAYNKWIRMQVEDWLGLPELYRALPPLLSVGSIESAELSEKGKTLRALLDTWT